MPLLSEGLVESPEAGQKPPLADSTQSDREKERRDRRRAYVRNYNREWAKKYPERIAAIRRREHIKNAAAYKIRVKKYSKTPKFKARVARYFKKYLPGYYEKNRERLNQKASAYAKSHPDMRHRMQVNWRKNHPESYRAHARAGRIRRKARMVGADVGCPHVNALIRKWRLRKSFECYWCGDRFGIRSLHVDHIIPISKKRKTRG